MRCNALAAIGSAACALAIFATPAAATFPGQNGSIVYIDGGPGSGHVMTMNADGSNKQQLTSKGGNNDPSFSADGKQIVFAHRVGKHTVIDVMSADGSGKEQLTSKHRDEGPAFSPNGKTIVFSRSGSRKQCGFRALYLIRSDGSHLRTLTQAPSSCAVDQQPSYSPDGRTVVFEGLDSEDFFINSIGASGGSTKGLIDGDVEPSFSPSGQQILYAEGFLPSDGIGVMNADGSNPQTVAITPDPHLHYGVPSYSPDGSKIVFYGIAHKATDVYTVNPNGSGLLNLTNDGTAYSPDWGPLATP